MVVLQVSILPKILPTIKQSSNVIGSCVSVLRICGDCRPVYDVSGRRFFPLGIIFCLLPARKFFATLHSAGRLCINFSFPVNSELSFLPWTLYSGKLGITKAPQGLVSHRAWCNSASFLSRRRLVSFFGCGESDQSSKLAILLLFSRIGIFFPFFTGNLEKKWVS